LGKLLRAGYQGFIGKQTMRGVISIIIGIVFIVGGLSGRLVLMGTQSGAALAAVGVVILCVGFFRLKSGA
jgi:hypothetical protein